MTVDACIDERCLPRSRPIRPNLAVRGDVLVDRILLDGNQAVGVRIADGEEIAAKEVIVSAGAIHSPAILLRSGIGVDDGLAVGANLKEHAATAGFEVALTRTGRMPSPTAPVMTSVARYTSGLAEAGLNDMQILWFNGVGPSEEGCAGARVIGAVMGVFSTGHVRLKSQDPYDDPEVEFNMLSDEARSRSATGLHAPDHQGPSPSGHNEYLR